MSDKLTVSIWFLEKKFGNNVNSDDYLVDKVKVYSARIFDGKYTNLQNSHNHPCSFDTLFTQIYTYIYG